MTKPNPGSGGGVGVAELPRRQTPRRGLNREEAARYVGVGTTKFDEMVGDGRMPKAKRIDGRVVYDVLKLDVAFDALPDDDAPVNSWAHLDDDPA